MLPGGFLSLVSDTTAVSASNIRGVGDLDRDGFDDLGATTFETFSGLDGGGTIQHQVIEIFGGGESIINRLSSDTASFVFEPDSAPFFRQGFGGPDEIFVPEPFTFTGAGFTGGSLSSANNRFAGYGARRYLE